MRVFIAYGSTEGQTRKIAQTVSDQICGLGHDVELFDTSGLLGELSPSSFDKIIVAGSVHNKRHQESVELFAMANLKALQAKPTLFISVSIAAAFEEGLPDAQSYVDSFVSDIGWQPGQTLLVAGAVRHGEYGYFKELVVEQIVLKDLGLDDPKKDHEFTNWESLAKAIEAFVAE